MKDKSPKDELKGKLVHIICKLCIDYEICRAVGVLCDDVKIALKETLTLFADHVKSKEGEIEKIVRDFGVLRYQNYTPLTIEISKQIINEITGGNDERNI